MSCFTLWPQRLIRVPGTSGASGGAGALFPPDFSTGSTGSGWIRNLEATVGYANPRWGQSKLQSHSSKIRNRAKILWLPQTKA